MKCYIAIYIRILEDLGLKRMKKYVFDKEIYAYYIFKLELLNLIGSNISSRKKLSGFLQVRASDIPSTFRKYGKKLDPREQILYEI